MPLSDDHEYKPMKPCIVFEDSDLAVYCIFENDSYRWIDNDGELVKNIPTASTLEEAMVNLKKWNRAID